MIHFNVAPGGIMESTSKEAKLRFDGAAAAEREATADILCADVVSSGGPPSGGPRQQ